MMIKKLRQAANSKHYIKKWTSNTEYKNDIYNQCVKRITDDQLFDVNASKVLRVLISEVPQDEMINSERIKKVLFRER